MAAVASSEATSVKSGGASKKKLLLMGKSGSGKTSMRSIIFANYLARDTMRLGPTLDVEHSHVRFLGNLVLNLWDCGGQDAFYTNYFKSQRDHIFRNVELLIYVFDIESRNMESDFEYYKGCIDAISENSDDARVFVLIHKMDLIPLDQRDAVFEERSSLIKAHSKGLNVSCFKTSIWDETLYKAWSSIVHSLIPNINQIESNLNKFCEVCSADEVVLFEKATFLVISHAHTKQHRDVHRFEKISNIIKQFKLSCSKIQSQFAPGTVGNGDGFSAMRVRNSNFTALIEEFTTNTFIMVISSDDSVQATTVRKNIKMAQSHFHKYIKQIGI
jgi:Ras-related GTP-binding protein A/B